jgi:hypothetical protein
VNSYTIERKRRAGDRFAVAKKIAENVLQEDQKLIMWYDRASTRVEVDSNGKD